MTEVGASSICFKDTRQTGLKTLHSMGYSLTVKNTLAYQSTRGHKSLIRKASVQSFDAKSSARQNFHSSTLEQQKLTKIIGNYILVKK